ncbi:MAG: translation initiation factor IF-2 [Planctomycetes bacterium]|nr:translation initiation factor IF-2 [Planctomycetota bacterium]
MASKPLRVFELAKELDVTSKAVIDKCAEEGIVLKNHMAVLTAGLAASIREWFSESGAKTAIESGIHVDLEQEHAKAKKSRRRRGKEKAEQPDQAAPPEPDETTTAAEAAVAASQSPSEAHDAAAAAAASAEQPQAAAKSPEPQAKAAVADSHAKVGHPHVPGSSDGQSQQSKQKPQPAKPADRKPAKQEQGKDQRRQKERQEIKPAGPQLVPKPAKLKGPKVIRVEKPDYVRAPIPRSSLSTPPPPLLPGAARKGKPLAKGAEEELDEKGKRRSPRRRGSSEKTAEKTGEKLKEWRNQDLIELSERLAAAGGGLRRHRANISAKQDVQHAKPGKVEISEPITIKSFSQAAGIKASNLIQKLMNAGQLVTINHVLDRQTAEDLAAEYGVELVIEKVKTIEDELLDKLAARPKGQLTPRAPVVTFLGHVDHGKTSLLDRIRKASVAAGEAGGITQHIGAYRCDMGSSHVVFLDTPGHEAFTAMRSRGAKMTDVVVLVVAADDGMMPQTIEALSHAKAAGVPIVVALNKIDLPNANEPKALGQLAEHELNPREWGGTTEVIRTSATTGQGIDTLVETLSLEAELLELKAETGAPASGYVIEAQMNSGLGVMARLLVLNGTLKTGDVVLAGGGYGRVRNIRDGLGKNIEKAGPSTPVEISGLNEVPQAGDRFYVVADLETARQVAEHRIQDARQSSLASTAPKSLEELLGKIEAGQTDELSIIVKADVQGSIEAITGSLAKLGTSEIKVKVLHGAVGGITTGDVGLAQASDAVIIGFNVVPDAAARQLAETLNVEIKLYRIIYDIIEDIRQAMEKGLAPEIQEKTLGRAEVRQTFKISRFGTIAGCHVADGVVNRSAKVRIIRNSVVIADERSMSSLKRFKDDVRDVRAGMDCGIKIDGYDDIKEGDTFEFYQKIEVARKL